MNVGGGEAADQVVRMMLSGTEVAVRLGGSALKNMLALTLALAKNRKTVSGKLNLRKMLRETRDLRRFPMTSKQYKKFKKFAKKYKLLYSVIRDKDAHGKIKDVILPVTELDRANSIFDRIQYTTPPEPEREPVRPLQRGREVFEPERQAQRGSDNPQRGSGRPRHRSGRPRHRSGRPRHRSGRPQRGSGKPRHRNGRPQRGNGKPRRRNSRPRRKYVQRPSGSAGTGRRSSSGKGRGRKKKILGRNAARTL